MAQWVIAGAAKDAVPEVGKTYEIRYSRKGTFDGRVTSVSGEWATVEIVGGVAKAAMSYNVAYEGESVTVRDAMTYWIPKEVSP